MPLGIAANTAFVFAVILAALVLFATEPVPVDVTAISGRCERSGARVEVHWLRSETLYPASHRTTDAGSWGSLVTFSVWDAVPPVQIWAIPLLLLSVEVSISTVRSSYLMGESEFGTGMQLRVEEPDQSHETINWADEYRFEKRWPH